MKNALGAEESEQYQASLDEQCLLIRLDVAVRCRDSRQNVLVDVAGGGW